MLQAERPWTSIRIRFDLAYVQNLAGVVQGVGEYAGTTTVQVVELHYGELEPIRASCELLPQRGSGGGAVVMVLPAAAGAFVVRDEGGGWCRVALECAGLRVELGAEDRRVLIPRLRLFAEGSLVTSVDGEIGGQPVGWLLSLSEKHTSWFVASVGEQRALHIQGADGVLMHTAVFSADDLRRWCIELESGI